MKFDEILKELKQLNKEERQLLFSNFCKDCADLIEEDDWNGRNYCVFCSPDPDSND